MAEYIFANRKLPRGEKIYIMGILNVTPDSFSDGGKYFSPGNALEHARQMLSEGADIIDVGACSTRPGGKPVTKEEELSRLESVVPALRKLTDSPVSVDTFWSDNAAYCLSQGVDIINDVGGVFCEETASLIKSAGAGWVLMHGGVLADYKEEYPLGAVNDIRLFFDEMSSRAREYGIEKNICLDPGFGFSKTTAENIEVLKNLGMLTGETPLLAGLSNKRFVGEISSEPDSARRLPGTLACNVSAVLSGAEIIRTHEIKMHRACLDAAFALK